MGDLRDFEKLVAHRGSDGAKIVYVQYKDNAGNVSATYSDGITLDATAPNGTMSVNSGAAYTGTTAATVNSTVSDTVSGISQMSIDPGTGTYGSWIAYARARRSPCRAERVPRPSGSSTATRRATP